MAQGKEAEGRQSGGNLIYDCHNLIDFLPQVKDAIENIGQTIVSSMEGCFSAQDTDTIIRVSEVYFFII